MLRSVTGPMAAKVLEKTAKSVKSVRREVEIMFELCENQITKDELKVGAMISLLVVLASFYTLELHGVT
jgi:hypothetical protein